MSAVVLDFNTAPAQGEGTLAPIDRAAEARRLEELRRRLPGHAEGIVRHLFPLARIANGEARIGDVNGERGESLAVELAGEKAGQWIDHATGGQDRGDLITLWQAATGCDFAEAVTDLEGIVGGSAYVDPFSRARVERVRVQRQEAAKNAGPEPRKVKSREWVYRSADGASELARVVRYDLVNEAGQVVGKTFAQRGADPGVWKAPTSNRPLYNLPGIAAEPVVVLCEGEKAADALVAAGVAATSAMGGSGAPLELTDWSPLRGKRVILWPDNDGPGATEAKSFVGQKFMARVRDHLALMGVPCVVLPIPEGKPAKWDAADADPTEAVGLAKAGVELLNKAPAPANDPGDVFRVLDVDELLDAPPVEWRIDGVFPTHGMSVLYGGYQTFKTFVALSMTLSLATGRPWMGRQVRPCPVLYVAGEGQRGVGDRVAGWLDRAGISRDAVRGRFVTLPEVVAIPDRDNLEKLVRTVLGLPERPGVIVLDTLTRMAGGASLNDEQAMQGLVAAVDRLKDATGSHVMLIGHSGRAANGLLGSVVVPAACETMICVERAEGADGVTLINDFPKGKQKEGEAFPDMPLVMVGHAFQHRDAWRKTLVAEMAVVAPAGPPSDAPGRGGAGRRSEGDMSPAHRRILAWCQEGDREFTQDDARDATGYGRRAVSEAMQKFVGLGLLFTRQEGQRVFYRPNPEQVDAADDALR